LIYAPVLLAIIVEYRGEVEQSHDDILIKLFKLHNGDYWSNLGKKKY